MEKYNFSIMKQEKLSTPDHDLLITLRAEFSAFARQYTIDMRELKDGYSMKIADHELRLAKLEKLATETDPLKNLAEFYKLKEQMHDFKTSATAWRVMAGAVGGALLWIITELPNWIKIWFR